MTSTNDGIEVIRPRNLARRLRELRREVRVQQYRVADRLGMPNTRLCRIERGYEDVPEGFEQRYLGALEQITRERYEGACRVTDSPVEPLGERVARALVGGGESA
jgi:transcriptional regulator with XRE-family HTH domain